MQRPHWTDLSMHRARRLAHSECVWKRGGRCPLSFQCESVRRPLTGWPSHGGDSSGVPMVPVAWAWGRRGAGTGRLGVQLRPDAARRVRSCESPAARGVLWLAEVGAQLARGPLRGRFEARYRWGSEGRERLGVRSRRRDRGRLSSEAEMGQDPVDGIRSPDRGDHHAPPTTVGATQDVHREDAFEQLGPGVTAVGRSAASPF